MGFKCGIVGLPNVGKSTLFNALTNSTKAQAENFPFCTIDPNIGIVPVPDERLENLSNEYKSFEEKKNDTKSELGDQVIFNYKATVENKDFEGGKGETAYRSKSLWKTMK